MLKYDKQAKLDSINGALALRSQINDFVDSICERGYSNICWLGIGGTYASALQATVHMKEKTTIDVFTENASEYIYTGNQRITDKTIIIVSSVTGSTEEIVNALKKAQKANATILAFVDAGADSPIGKLASHVISYPENEQLKFFMVADRFMYNNGEFPDYDEYYQEMDKYLAQALVEVAESSDKFALDFALKHHDDDLHYFVGAGNQYGATYSYAMCYWEEQHWIRTKSIHSAEFFHGMFEVIERDSNVTVFIGEDSQRAISERVANFLPRICANYTIIDTKDYELKGISDKYRGSISHLVMMEVCHRIDAHIEKINCHPTEIRRYYRQLDY